MKNILAIFFILASAGALQSAGIDYNSGGTGSGTGSGTSGAQGAPGQSNKCYGGLAASLIAAGTDYATSEPTTSVTGLLPYYVRAFDGSTTEYMRGSIVLEPSQKLLSNVTFYANVRPKTAASGKNVQMMFSSTATSTGGEVSRLVISTGADIVPLSASMHKWTLFNWSQSVSNLGWAPLDIVHFGFSRAHDTSKLTNTELEGDLYWGDWKICVDLQ